MDKLLSVGASIYNELNAEIQGSDSKKVLDESISTRINSLTAQWTNLANEIIPDSMKSGFSTTTGQLGIPLPISRPFNDADTIAYGNLSTLRARVKFLSNQMNKGANSSTNTQINRAFFNIGNKNATNDNIQKSTSIMLSADFQLKLDKLASLI